MRSIERRFNKVTKENPQWTSLVCFSEAIKDQAFTGIMMRRWFYKLVDKYDYERKDKKQVLQSLDELLKVSKTTKK